VIFFKKSFFDFKEKLLVFCLEKNLTWYHDLVIAKKYQNNNNQKN